MNATVVLFLAATLAIVRGRLTVLRGKEQSRRYTHGNRKLLCASEDDAGALIWNGNLNWVYDSYEFSDRGGSTDFHLLNAYERTEIDCEFDSHDGCASRWNSTGWTLTNSKRTPMGPVLDRRWEGFREHNNFGRLNKYRWIDAYEDSGSLAISVRGSTDAHILLCDTESYENDFCYWIIIGGWANTESVIRKCAKGVPDPRTYPIEPTCAEIRASYFHETLSPVEWRTFVLTWNSISRSVSVYDTRRLLMTYVDNEGRPRNQTSVYNLFLRSTKTMLFRLHTYGFFRTRDRNATLTSPAWTRETGNVCLEMILGLCAECRTEVMLIDSEGNEETIETARGSKVAVVPGLPAWQYVRINKTLSSDFGRTVRVKLVQDLEGENPEPLWAVADVRICPPRGTIRLGSMDATQDYKDGTYFWPNVTCQKLFYEENIAVDSVPDAKFDYSDPDPRCPEGMLGPYCAISCYNHLENSLDCRGTAICDERGCTCPPGFLGADCRSNCYIGQYGHGCKQTCGWCQGDNCSFATGQCKSGCDNSKRYNIPPFCKTGIDILPPPNIDFVNETIIRAILPVRKEYTLIPSGYQFALWKKGEAKSRLIGDYVKIFNDTMTMTGYADDLEPGTSYRISCILYVNNDFVPIHGEWQNFTTRCTPTTEFKVDAKNTSLALLQSRQTQVPNPCPDKWYDLLLENLDTRVQIVKGQLTRVPQEFQKLSPYTNYKITISKGPAILFSREIRTLDGAPSQVRNVRKSLSADEVTLKWDPSLNPNGVLRKYEVTLQVRAYVGCENFKMQPPEHETISTVTSVGDVAFQKLTPYARYVVRIVAFTSLPGEEAQVEFLTDQTDTPTAMYSNLRFRDYILAWDPPRDCRTISGPIVARITVTGISEGVANFTITRQTIKYSINLNDVLRGAETYRARVHAIRDYHRELNELLYQELVFATPPKEPPPVRDLEIYEVDTRSGDIFLRWLEPRPPVNGEIEYYSVSSCDTICEILARIKPTERCGLWSDYVCACINHSRAKLIAVSAVNANVPTAGEGAFAQVHGDDAKPEAPGIFTAAVLDRGVVNFTWSHPWRTGGRVSKFLLAAEMVSTRLRTPVQRSQRGTLFEYPVEDYRKEYTEELRLIAASVYKISVRAVTTAGIYGEKRVATARTPSAAAFQEEPRAEARHEDSTISLRIPGISNDTANSRMYVVVRGPGICANSTAPAPGLREKAGIEDYETAWFAAVDSTDKLAGRTIAIGDGKIYGGGRNCQLRPGESYLITVIVRTGEDSKDEGIVIASTARIRVDQLKKRHDEAWLIPVTVILAAGAFALYFYRRRRRKSSTKLTLGDEVAYTSKAESPDARSTLSSSRRELSSTHTLSDKEFLSRASTPFDDVAVCPNDTCQIEERMSPVKAKDFEEYVRRAVESGLLYRQYATLPRGQTRPWDYGKLPGNKSKNRYGNLIAYDENRVTLEKLADDPCSDYINASYIKGYKKEKCYIATQGPKANTVVDFWRMIWQEECYVVCMIANLVEGGKTKCEQYWPDIGKKKRYGEMIVFTARHTVFADFTLRTLHVQCGEEARKIEQLHYTAWPDHGVPLSTHSVATYLKKLLATPTGNGPMVVHCSAGVGRTGTIVLCDICLRRAAVEGVVDVFAESQAIRSQRANTIDNSQQYLLAHFTLVECLLSFPASLPCDATLANRIQESKKQLVIQRDSLERMTWQDKVLRPSTEQPSLSRRNVAKNRFPESATGNISRVYLKRYPATDEDSDYVSAVCVDGVRLQNQYLATQLPLPGTFSDFWRMIAEHKVELIVMLQPPDLQDASPISDLLPRRSKRGIQTRAVHKRTNERVHRIRVLHVPEARVAGQLGETGVGAADNDTVLDGMETGQRRGSTEDHGAAEPLAGSGEDSQRRRAHGGRVPRRRDRLRALLGPKSSAGENDRRERMRRLPGRSSDQEVQTRFRETHGTHGIPVRRGRDILKVLRDLRELHVNDSSRASI